MKILMTLLAWLPLQVLRVGAAIFGVLAYLLLHHRRKITRVNLSLAFARESTWRRELRCIQHFVALAQSLADRAWIWRGSQASIKSRITLQGLEILPRNRNIVLLAPHMVGVDAAWTRLAIEGLPLTGLYQPQRHPKKDALIRSCRLRRGNVRCYSRHAGIRNILNDFKDGRMFYCLPDMDFGPKDALFVPLFGQQAATLTVLPKLARISRALIIPVITRMTSSGYHITIEPPWQDLDQMPLHTACRRMNAAVEGWAIEAGAEYLWSHRRYKTRPKDAASLY